MSESRQSETFPLEVWLRVLDYGTPSVHRAMSQLSSAFHQISRKRLYHTLVFGNQVYMGVTSDTASDATWCRDPKLFYKVHKDRNDLKQYVHRVYVQCCKSILIICVLCSSEGPLAPWRENIILLPIDGRKARAPLIPNSRHRGLGKQDFRWGGIHVPQDCLSIQR